MHRMNARISGTTKLTMAELVVNTPIGLQPTDCYFVLLSSVVDAISVMIVIH